MFGFIKLIFISTMLFFGCSLPSVNYSKSILMNNQKCKVRPQIVNVNSEEPVFFNFSIKISKWSGSCNSINDPYAKLWVADAAKYLNVRLFNLMSRTNETRYTESHETCKCKCRLNGSACNRNNFGMKVNASVNVKNWSIKVHAIKDLFGIRVIVSVNVINHVMLVSI